MLKASGFFYQWANLPALPSAFHFITLTGCPTRMPTLPSPNPNPLRRHQSAGGKRGLENVRGKERTQSRQRQYMRAVAIRIPPGDRSPDIVDKHAAFGYACRGFHPQRFCPTDNGLCSSNRQPGALTNSRAVFQKRAGINPTRALPKRVDCKCCSNG